MSFAIHLGRNGEFGQPLQELLFATIFTADQFERRFASFLKLYELTLCQYDILAALDDADGQLPTGAINERLARKATALSANLDRRTRAEFVKRARDTDDRQQINIVLLERGRNTLARIGASLTEWQETLIGHLTYAEAEQASRLHRKAANPCPK